MLERGADYVLTLKGNQGTLHADVSQYLDNPTLTRACDLDGDHSRIETRQAFITTDVERLPHCRLNATQRKSKPPLRTELSRL